MYYDFKCKNEKCDMFNKLVELNVPYEDIEKQICENCSKSIDKIFNFNGGIKMADGLYKG